MATDNEPAAPGSAAPAPAAPAAVDPRAAALAMFENAETRKEAGAFGDAKGTVSAVEAPKDGAPPAEAKPPAPAEKDRLSAGYAALARQKADLLKRETDLKGRAAAFEAWQANQDKIKANPAAVLDVYGLTIEQVAEAYLRAQAEQAEPTAEERLAALEAERAAEKKAGDDARKDAEKQADETRAKQIRDAGLAVVVDVLDAATFPTICALGEQEQAFAALSAYAKKHNLSADQITTDVLKQVAAGVEQALVEEYRGLFEKAPHIAKREPVPSTEKPATGQPIAAGAQGTRSTSLASSEVSGAPAPQPGRRYTREELRAMALAHFVAN